MGILSSVRQILFGDMSTSVDIKYQKYNSSWNNFSVRKAVREGLQTNPWVYKSIWLIAKNGSSPNWGVYDTEGNLIENHHLTQLFKNPSSEFSKQDLMELLLSWLELTGKGFWKKIIVAGRTTAIIPISPDKIRPIRDPAGEKLIGGYGRVKNNGMTATIDADLPIEEIIYFRFSNPADPIDGIGPLEVLSRTIDLEREQEEWSKSTMENRGNPSGIISIKEKITDSQWKAVIDRFKERLLGKENARIPYILSGDAAYYKTDPTPVEMDFIDSGKISRDKIFATFGIPLPLAGVSETMTYSNFSESIRVLWKITIIPILDDIRDKLNSPSGFGGELLPGQFISYDLSAVSHLSDDESKISVVAKSFWDMGVPFNQLNEKYKFNIGAFDGSDISWGGRSMPSASPVVASVRAAPPSEIRALKIDVKSQIELRDDFAENLGLETVGKFLGELETSVLDSLEKSEQLNVELVFRKYRPILQAYTKIVATEIANQIIKTNRAVFNFRDTIDDEINQTVDDYLQQEAIILNELSKISDITVSTILEQMAYAKENNLTVQQVSQALKDLNLFDPIRALRISRTITGAAGSIGQLSSAKVSGMATKTWHTSGGNVRDLHTAREGETVPIDGVFSGGAKYPLDPNLSADDRVNCRCSMTFKA